MKSYPCLRSLDLQSSNKRWVICSGSQDLLGIKGLRSKPEAERSRQSGQVYEMRSLMWSGDSGCNRRSEVRGLRVYEGRLDVAEYLAGACTEL